MPSKEFPIEDDFIAEASELEPADVRALPVYDGDIIAEQGITSVSEMRKIDPNGVPNSVWSRTRF